MFTSPLGLIQALKVKRLTRRSPYKAALADLPAPLFAYWASSAPAEFEGIPRDAYFFARAAEALLQFFDCAAGSDQPCALPSKAADSVWHAWLRMNSIGLEQFCIKHFGAVIPHVEAAAMDAPTAQSLAVCLVKARTRERLQRGGSGLPRLFSADRELGMPQGYAYQVRRGKVGLSPMSRQGQPMSEIAYPASFAPDALLMSGLIHSWEVEPKRHAHDGGSDSGWLSGGIGSSGDGGSTGDAGCDGGGSSSCGGSSCGSSCGSSS